MYVVEGMQFLLLYSGVYDGLTVLYVDARMTARFDDRLRTFSTESCNSLKSEQKEKKGKDEVTSRLFL